MFRSSPVIYAACGVTTLIVLTPLTTYWQSGWESEVGPIRKTDGRVQLAVDEQDLGDVEAGAELEVCFLVTNVGKEILLLRQAASSKGTGGQSSLYTVSPGRTIAVIARLNSNDLAGRGRKHICFHTSDAHCPELWLTVRGTPVISGSAMRL
jgi:hypothetical protein